MFGIFFFKVLHAIDILLAELHRVCIYTIPMHLVYRKSIFQSEEAHFKSIGYREDGENLEYKSFFFKLKYRRLFKPARIIYKVVWCTGAGCWKTVERFRILAQVRSFEALLFSPDLNTKLK
ncbi:hypothetical protein P8452_04458 [Trifolium repens]|nr:hypothetical protein P8452_04458 [Trifolium repens]